MNYKSDMYYCSEPILCPRLCGTLSSSYSSLDPFCYDYQLTCLYLVRQSVYIQMSTCNILSLILVLKLATSLHSAVPQTCHTLVLRSYIPFLSMFFTQQESGQQFWSGFNVLLLTNLLQRDPSVMKFWKQKNRHSILKQIFEVVFIHKKNYFTVLTR